MTKKKDIFSYFPYIILGIYFMTGSILLPRYGISTDEPIQRKHGMISFEYVTEQLNLFPDIPKSTNEDLQFYSHRYHGVTFQLFSYIIEKSLKIEDAKSVFLLRHTFIFLLFFVGIVYFHRLVLYQFGKQWIAALGILFIILSPRIFVEAFYNPKDIVLLSWMMIGMYTLLKFLDNFNTKYIIVHALICALAINSRIIAILLPFVTVLISIIVALKAKRLKSIGIRLAVWFSFTIVFMVAFWPVLWENTFKNFLYLFNTMKQFPWNGTMLYWGNLITGNNVRWHYTLSQILVTTPVLYTILFLIGLFYILRKQLIKNKLKFYGNNEERNNIIFLLLFFIPLIAVIYFDSTLYNGWRHTYFIYPSFLLIALYGVKQIIGIIKAKTNVLKRKILISALTSIICVSCVFTIFQLVKNHPFQHVCYNILVGKEPLRNFDGDYFGTSYKEAYEFLFEKYPNDTLNIYVSHVAGSINLLNFSLKEVNRVKITNQLDEADFFITNYYFSFNRHFYDKYWNNEFPFNLPLIYCKKYRGSNIIGIYKLK